MYHNPLAGKIVKTGMTFGGFDVLHFGHVELLRRASELCEKLIVCISSDEYLKETKGDPPLLSYDDRVELVLVTGYAGAIFKQDIGGKEGLIKTHKPDLLFVGNDWTSETYDGEGLCDVFYLPRTMNISTGWYRERFGRDDE